MLDILLHVHPAVPEQALPPAAGLAARTCILAIDDQPGVPVRPRRRLRFIPRVEGMARKSECPCRGGGFDAAKVLADRPGWADGTALPSRDGRAAASEPEAGRHSSALARRS